MIKFKTVLVCLMVLVLFWDCKKSPTTPEQPKPRAIIEVNVKDESKLTFYWEDWRKAWVANFTVVVSEHNGVGGTVTICQLIFEKDGQVVQTSTYSGGNFPAYGTCEIDKEVELINQCLKSKLNTLIIIYGKNNNDLTVITKFNQLKSLGFSNVYMYLGGLFEWLLLQDVYGNENFPTTTSEIDILKYK